MTLTEIADMLAGLDLPVTYYSYPEGEAPAPPYCIYYYPSSDNFSADNIVYNRVYALNIELYTSEKSFTDEAMVESMLADHGLFWDKTETYINSEEMYEVLYQMEVLINGE